MMREILFRGKRSDNGEWVEGQLLYFRAITSENELALIVESCEWDNSNEWFNLCKRAKVIPETVGQYTGLKDKNGKKIFEGDIVIDKYSKEKFGFVGIVIYNPTLTQFQIYSDKHPNYVVNLGSRMQSVKVLGNIHDNPELLKGGAE